MKIHQDTRATRYFPACGLYTWQNKVSWYYLYHLFVKCKCLFCWQVYSAVPRLYLWKSNQYQSNLHQLLRHKASKQDLKARTHARKSTVTLQYECAANTSAMHSWDFTQNLSIKSTKQIQHEFLSKYKVKRHKIYNKSK